MIPIVYCGNKKIYEGIILSSISVARRTKESLGIYLFTMDDSSANKLYVPLTEEQRANIEKAIRSFNSNSFVVLVDMTEYYKIYFKGGKNLKNSYTPYALLRLLMDKKDLIPYDKAIYLDCDIMANGDIAKLWNIDVEEYELAAVPDQVGSFWIRKDYCNSGVILFNLAMCRKTAILEKARVFVFLLPFFMPDQTAIHLLATKKKLLDVEYNRQLGFNENTIIKHFNKEFKLKPFPHFSNIKQWNRDKVRKVLKITNFDEDYAFYDEFIKNNQ